MIDEALRRGHIVTEVVATADMPKTRKGLKVVKGDINDLADVGRKLADEDAVIAVVNSEEDRAYPAAARSLVTASRVVGAWAPRIIWIGDAAALHDDSGDLVLMTLPQDSRVGRVLGQAQTLRTSRPWAMCCGPISRRR